MEDLRQLISEENWSQALKKATTLGLSTDIVYQSQWLTLSCTENSATSQARELLSAIHDKRWVATAALNARFDDSLLLRDIFTIGLAATDRLAHDDNIPDLLNNHSQQYQDQDQNQEQEIEQTLFSEIQSRPLVQSTCKLRIQLLQTLYLLDTFDDIFWSKNEQILDNLEDDDPFQEDNNDTELDGEQANENDFDKTNKSPVLDQLLTFSAFVSVPILQHALSFAAIGDFESLQVLFSRHYLELFPQRFLILESIPEDIDVSEYANLLPRVKNSTEAFYSKNSQNEQQQEITASNFLVNPDDWAQSPVIYHALHLVHPSTLLQSSSSQLLSESDLTRWYIDRINTIDYHTANLPLTLSFARASSSFGLPSLKDTFKQLCVLYDFAQEQLDLYPSAPLWTLQRWKSINKSQQFETLLESSKPDTIVNNISHRIRSLLEIEFPQNDDNHQVLESLSNFIIDYILNNSSAKINLITPIFQSSKPTLPKHERLIQDPTQLAKLGISCLYSSFDTNSWEQMSNIFECLPAFEDEKVSSPVAQSALNNLLLSPSSSSSPTTAATTSSIPPALTLYQQMDSWSPGLIASVLDHLDLHLEQAEIFARWNIPTTLSWFIRNVDNSQAQASCATSFARREIGHRGEFESDDEWLALLDDMITWTSPREDGIRPALNLLDKDTVQRIFFGGVLSTGRFSLAKSLFNPSNGKRPLEPSLQEELVISASKEFYDNAESGNLNEGEMKLALDCLSVVQQTPAIRAQRDFIEATSRLTSFRITSQNGDHVLCPIEIRLTKDKLDLIDQLLKTSKDACLYVDMVLELVDKLGYRNDLCAHTKVLAMISNSAAKSGYFAQANSVCEQMITTLGKLEQKLFHNSSLQDSFDEAKNVAWKACYQLSQEQKFNNIDARLRLLSHALRFCPPSEITNLLVVYRVIKTMSSNAASSPNTATSSISPLQSFGLASTFRSQQSNLFNNSPSSTPVITPAEVAERAARSFSRAASSYFGRSTPSPSSATTRLPSTTASTSITNDTQYNHDNKSKAKADSPNFSSSSNQQHSSLFPFGSSLSRPAFGSNFLVSSNSPSSSSLSLSSQNDSFKSTQQTQQQQQPLSSSTLHQDQNQQDFASSIGNTLSDKFTAGVGWLIGAEEDDYK